MVTATRSIPRTLRSELPTALAFFAELGSRRRGARWLAGLRFGGADFSAGRNVLMARTEIVFEGDDPSYWRAVDAKTFQQVIGVKTRRRQTPVGTRGAHHGSSGLLERAAAHG